MPIITTQALEDGALDLEHIAELATDHTAGGTPISSSTDRLGNIKPTISEVLNNLLDYKQPIPWPVSTEITDPLQIYTYLGVEYAPISSAIPFNTGPTFDPNQFRVWQRIGTTVKKTEGRRTGSEVNPSTGKLILNNITVVSGNMVVYRQGVYQEEVYDYTVDVGDNSLNFTGIFTTPFDDDEILDIFAGEVVANSTTANLVTFSAPSTRFGAASTNVQTYLAELDNRLTQAVNVKDPEFGATGDGVTDDTAAIQAAAAALVDGGPSVLYFPPGIYIVSGTINIARRGAIVRGAGKDATEIVPTGAQADIFTIGNERIEFYGFWFRPLNYTKGVQETGFTVNCIKTLNIGDSDAAITWFNLHDCVFENLKGAGLLISSPLRESWIWQNNFIGMTNKGTGIGAIHGAQAETFLDSTNNVWINHNTFFRFGAPAVLLDAVNGSSPAKHNYDNIHIHDNLIHSQLLDINDREPGEAVQAEPTDSVVIRNCSIVKIHHNHIASYHPDHLGIFIQTLGSQDKNDSIEITYNRIFVDNVVLPPMTYAGNAIRVQDSFSHVIERNAIKAGFHSADIFLQDSGAFSFTAQVDISNNYSTNVSDPLITNQYNSFRGELFGREFKITRDDIQVNDLLTYKRAGTELLTATTSSSAILFSSLSLSDMPNSTYQIQLTANESLTATGGIYTTSKSTTGFTINRVDTTNAVNIDWFATDH